MESNVESNVGQDLHKIIEECTSADADADAGYVLITCNRREGHSQLNIRMTYQGDPILISYLLENGADKMLQDIQVEEEGYSCS